MNAVRSGWTLTESTAWLIMNGGDDITPMGDRRRIFVVGARMMDTAEKKCPFGSALSDETFALT
jgi:hypothetical protein